MPQIFLSTDTHLGHPFLSRLRGYSSVAEHDEAIIRNIWRRTRGEGILFLLGDLVLGPADEKVGRLERLAGLADEVHVVLGNHDRPHPGNGNGHAHIGAWSRIFTSVQTVTSIRHEGRTILLSHFPYDGEGATREDHEDRFTQWRVRDEGRLLLHGHLHDTVKFRRSAAGSPMVHVGLDAWGLAPVSLYEAVSAADEAA